MQNPKVGRVEVGLWINFTTPWWSITRMRGDVVFNTLYKGTAAGALSFVPGSFTRYSKALDWVVKL